MASTRDRAVDLSKFDPFTPDMYREPNPWWHAMREASPVYRDPGSGQYYAVSYRAVDDIVRRPEVFSSQMSAYMRTSPADEAVAAEVAAIRAAGWAEVPALLTQDNPMHKRQRVLVNKAFSHRRIRELQGFIQSLVAGLADGLAAQPEADFIAEFAKPLPLRLIAHLLSVPDERLSDLKRWTDNRFANLGNKADRELSLTIARSEVERQQYFASLFEARKTHPEDDLLTAMVTARLGADDGVEGEPLSMEELLTMVGMLMAAGNETTTSLLSQSMVHISQHPELWQRLRSDPEGLAPAFVEEALRMFSPTQTMPRIAVEDTELEGVAIPRGSLVMTTFAAANRDPEHFPDPDTFDPDRENMREHLGFGRGIHLCLGASLARIEAEAAFTALAQRIAEFTVTTDTPDFLPSFRQRGLRSLPMRITPAA